MTGDNDGIIPVLRFPIRKPYMTVGGAATGYNSFKIDYGETIEYVAMERQLWAFYDSWIRGVKAEHYEVPDSRSMVAVALGYRCLQCRKVFFAADEAGLVHECMEAAAVEAQP